MIQRMQQRQYQPQRRLYQKMLLRCPRCGKGVDLDQDRKMIDVDKNGRRVGFHICKPPSQ